MGEYIADDRGMHELWEAIQSMTDEEKEKYIQEYEKQKEKQKEKQ